MENLEKQFEQELSASRMQIELLRNQVLLQYYTQLLELDPLLQPQEVKALMSCINTLERYARKYDSKKKHNDTTQASSAIQQSARSDNENIDSIPDNNQKQDPCNLTIVNPLTIVKETSPHQIPLVRPVKNQLPKMIKATTPGNPKGQRKKKRKQNLAQKQVQIVSNHSQNQYFKTSDRIPIKKYPGNQFRMRYSLGVTPTFCLNKRLKCCGYLNPKL